MIPEDDPPHHVLPDAYAWELREFVFRREPDWRETHIDMTFERNGVTRRLRFFAPRDLEMSRGLPHAVGMCILDVTRHQLEDIRVRVVNYEQDNGVPTFWAACVVDLDTADQFADGSQT